MALAEQQPFTDPTFQRLQNFMAIEHAICFWALVPGSVSDEASPFNECAHADLAAARALLLHMAKMPVTQAKAAALVASIERQMLDDRTSLTPCRFGEEPFSTSEYVYPHFGRLVSHPPTIAAFVFVLLVPVGCGAAVRGARRKRRSDGPR